MFAVMSRVAEILGSFQSRHLTQGLPTSELMLFALRHAVAGLHELCTKAFGGNLNKKGQSLSGLKFWQLKA